MRREGERSAGVVGEDARTIPAAVDVSAALVPPAPRRTVFDVGDVLDGRYRVCRRIASGGMGEVYEVDDQTLHERVALKTVRGDIVEQPVMMERFRREIQLARKITHPNVCRIFDVGFHRPDAGDPVPFLTMELLPGETLATRLRRHGPIAPRDALPLVEQMAAGLQAAHGAGVIHRDFKSANVMLVPDGGRVRVVITDFGLAKAAAGGHHADSTALTGGHALGTPAYMAPEQITGDLVDERADVYALGIVLFEMVTGCLPFDGETPLAMAVKRVTEPAPSPSSLTPDLDTRWVAAITCCLARDPAARFSSPQDVLRGLSGDDSPTMAVRTASQAGARSMRRPRLAWGVVLALAAIAASLAVAYLVRSPGSPLPAVAMPASLLAAATPRTPPIGTPYQRGVEHLRRWEAVAARTILEDVVAASPGDAAARLALCEAQRMARDLPQAISVAQRSLALADLPADVRRLTEACQRAARSDDAGAAALYQQAFADRADLETGVRLAQSQQAAGDATGLESTLAALADLPRSSGRDARLQVLEASARALRGDYAGARESYARAAKLARVQGLPMVEAEALFGEGRMLRHHGELHAAEERVSRARPLYAEAGERGRLAALDGLQSAVLYDLGQHRRNVVLRERLLEMAEQTGNRALVVEAILDLATSRFLIGDHHAGRRGIEAGLALAAELDLPLGNYGPFVRGWERLHAGDALASLRLTAEAMRPYPTDRYMVAYTEWDYGEAALLAGDLPTARSSLEKATDVASAARFFTSAECTRVLLALTALAEGKFAEAEVLAKRAVGELDRMGVRDCRVRGRVARARALHALGKRPEAHALLVDAASISTEDVWIRWELEVALAEDEIARGDPAAARARLQRVIDEAGGLGMSDAALAASVALGEIELGDPATAAQGTARLQAAIKRARVIGQRLVERRALGLVPGRLP